MNRNNHLNILIPSLGFDSTGGHRVLSELANNWIKKGHHVTFLINELSSEPYFPTSAKMIWTNYFGKITTKEDKRKKSLVKLNGWLNLVGLYLSLLKIGKNYDIILANHSLTAWPVRFANCNSAKKIYYIQAYEPDFFVYINSFKYKVLRWLSKESYDLKLKQICNSPIYIGYKNIKATEWVPPGIDFDLFYKKTEYKELNKAGEIILGCIGRKEPDKGIKYVLEALEQIFQKDKRFRLYVAFGNLPVDYSHPAVSIIYPQNDLQLANFYRSLDIMVAPGLIQLGAPHYPVMEAMACGIPVVTTGYLPANENNSWIVDVASAQAIVNSITLILNDGNYIDKVAIADEDILEFGWDYVSNKMIDTIFR